MAETRNKNHRRGAALLVVLFVVMAVSIISLGFITRCAAELNCGENMAIRTRVDYLAEVGLVCARLCILNGIPTYSGQANEPLSDYIFAYSYPAPVLNSKAAPSDPNTYTYIVEASSFRIDPIENEKATETRLSGKLHFEPALDGNPANNIAYYTSIRRN